MPLSCPVCESANFHCLRDPTTGAPVVGSLHQHAECDICGEIVQIDEAQWQALLQREPAANGRKTQRPADMAPPGGKRSGRTASGFDFVSPPQLAIRAALVESLSHARTAIIFGVILGLAVGFSLGVLVTGMIR